MRKSFPQAGIYLCTRNVWFDFFQSAPYIFNTRRDVREAEGARLESVCTYPGTVGSNPTLSG